MDNDLTPGNLRACLNETVANGVGPTFINRPRRYRETRDGISDAAGLI